MPELPEVETVRRGLAPQLVGHVIKKITVYNPNLRWKIPTGLSHAVSGSVIREIARRGKYLLLNFDNGSLILHLGMSGSLRVLSDLVPLQKHDHVDIVFDDQRVLRLRDPRRFGAVLWTTANPETHPLLTSLGPEPLSKQFNATWFYRETRGRNASIKQVLMNSRIVAGIGNIYANEALFRAGIKPQTPARRISLARCQILIKAIRATLNLAIKAGGSSLRDFVDSSGKPGYFQQQYSVYGRAGKPCLRCSTRIKSVRQGQRASFYCSRCQA